MLAALLAKTKWSEAEAQFKEVLRMDPNNAPALNGYGYCLVDRDERLKEGFEMIERAVNADPDNPEAHSYMGFILMQAGHGDGALMAFEKALTRAPNFPMALWGKGMVLYQDKKDFAGAREIFERLLNLVPPGEERNEVAKVLAETRGVSLEEISRQTTENFFRLFSKVPAPKAAA